MISQTCTYQFRQEYETFNTIPYEFRGCKHQMSAQGSLVQICALIIWPLLFSISSLIWSERQAHTITYLMKAKERIYWMI